MPWENVAKMNKELPLRVFGSEVNEAMDAFRSALTILRNPWPQARRRSQTLSLSLPNLFLNPPQRLHI